ncbi:TIGR01777 family protein [Owenweeksia hongkongensis DSM 17368]|uniref:TIGR01777 family protein n=1 Tax=Owenweeksia hongkongensis (strain DSM 17368 / CIP 108786 / JCM 12287 / NRRL B-23963 / UST20020801) TaxID=926562 RepID=G8R369_OWEHD|nr:TIGR01777 family oxidoreductase [Owenweeksia hongkongensis]AEV34094.1 TIGR01777 family protein [Owenweeksia hongkongensis DSM 17368]
MKILITGGTGLIGTEISKQLLEHGHSVVYFSRSPRKNNLGIQEYAWDVDKGTYDKKAFDGVEAIINLAGAPISERWTATYKSEILRSRVDATRLLYTAVQKLSLPLNVFVSASAVGYYPNDFNKTYNEDDAPGSDFLSLVTQKWEQEAQNFSKLNIRTVRIRVGVVLSNDGGAFPLITKPIKMGLGSPLGSGKQWMSWIHIKDVAGIFVYALENKDAQGIYNAVSPEPVTNTQMTEAIASQLDKPLWLPKVPEFAIKFALGEMSTTAIGSNKVSSSKVEKSGYSFSFPNLGGALRSLLPKA